MADVQHQGEPKILDKTSDLESPIGSLGVSESRLKCILFDLEAEIRTDDFQCVILEREIADHRKKHEREKNEFESVMEETSKKIETMSEELATIGVRQLQEKQDKITALQNSLTTLQAQHEKEYRLNGEKRNEIEMKNAKLAEQLSKIKETVNTLGEELEKITNENELQKKGKAELEKKICQCQHIILHKNEIIKTLEQTIESGRDKLVKESEFDLIIKKIKELRTENKNIRVENRKYEQENEKLTRENVTLRQEIDRLGLRQREEKQDPSVLSEENQKSQERVVGHTPYQELYEAAQKELQTLKVKVKRERENLNARIEELEGKKQSNIKRLISLENENIEKLKTISSLN